MQPFEIREFRPADAWGCAPPAETEEFTGLSALIDGRLAAYGGIRRVGTKHFAFFNIAAGVSAPIRFHRLVTAGLAAAERAGLMPVYSACEERTFASAGRWHRLLGFRELAEAEIDAELQAIEQQLGLKIWVFE